MMGMDSAQQLLLFGGGGQQTYLEKILSLLFGTPESAPIATPHIDSVGQVTVIQTDGQFSISAGELNFPVQSSPVDGDQGLIGDVMARVIGRTFYARIYLNYNNHDAWFGWKNNSSLASVVVPGTFVFYIASLLYTYGNSDFVAEGTYQASTYYDLMVALRTNGAIFMIKGGIWTDYTIIWVSNTGSGSVYPAFSNSNQAGRVAEISVADQLRGPFLDDYGLATSRIASAIANDTVTHTADGIIEATRTFAANDTYDLIFRRTDSSNQWVVRCSQSGSTVRLYEKVAGVETQRGTAAQTFTVGQSYRIVAKFYGNIVRVVVNGSEKFSYTSASFNNTATIGATNLAVADLVAWPRAVPANAITQINGAFFNYGNVKGLLVAGDSKSTTAYDYVPQLITSLASAGQSYQLLRREASSGIDVAALRARFVATPVDTNHYITDILINIGINNVQDTALTDITTDLTWIVEYLHTAYPIARIFIMRVGKDTTGHATWPAKLTTLNDTYIANVISAHSAYCFAGPDERVWMEGGDNYATYSNDGLHPNVAGIVVEVAQWRASMGY